MNWLTKQSSNNVASLRKSESITPSYPDSYEAQLAHNLIDKSYTVLTLGLDAIGDRHPVARAFCDLMFLSLWIFKELAHILIDWLVSDVIVGFDAIFFSEDELYYLANHVYGVPVSAHYYSGIIQYPNSDIEAWIGDYLLLETGFWEERCFKNTAEPSEYSITIRITRTIA